MLAYMDTLAHITLTDEATGNAVLIPIADIKRAQEANGFSMLWYKSGGTQTVQETITAIQAAIDVWWSE